MQRSSLLLQFMAAFIEITGGNNLICDSCIILELLHLQFILQKIISSASALFISLIDYWVSVVVSGSQW